MTFSVAFSTCIFYTLFTLIICAPQVTAFGAGNVASTSAIAGKNWRHGDIENVLLGLLLARSAGGQRFSKLNVKQVYFGNWLRDYSQAMDVGALKMVGPNIIRTLIWLLSFMTFGFGTQEFEVTVERLGVYRPEEHLDNPKDYADNIDATTYNKRLRGPVDESIELSVDERTGMKSYIASERLGIASSAGAVRRCLGQSIEAGRRYAKEKSLNDFHEGLRLLGQGLHTLEDFPAHSNYIELALRELGERSVFPHVGTATELAVRGHQVFPLVTGTFGSIDFLHSVLGEISDRTTLSELQQLDSQIALSVEKAHANGSQATMLKELITQLPPGSIDSEATANLSDLEERSNAKNFQTKARIDEGQTAWDYNTEDLAEQILPFMEFHDKIMRDLAAAMEEIPSHVESYQQVQNALSVLFFSLISPFILPVLHQVKAELANASTEVINSGRDKSDVVFSDPYSSDPTHSMLAKDHFSNVLNEPAGKIGTEIVQFVVPLIMRAWDDESMDVGDLLDYVLGVFHHPVCRDENKHRGQGAMFAVVRNWWDHKSSEAKDELRRALSMDGVREGRNHHGPPDSGHGCAHAFVGSGQNPGDATGGFFSQSSTQAALPGEHTSADAHLGGFIGTLGGVSAGILGGAAAGRYMGANHDRGHINGNGVLPGSLDGHKGVESAEKKDRIHRRRKNGHYDEIYTDKDGQKIPREHRKKHRTHSSERTNRRHRSSSRDRPSRTKDYSGSMQKDASRSHVENGHPLKSVEFEDEKNGPGKLSATRSRLSAIFDKGMNVFGLGALSGFGTKESSPSGSPGPLHRKGSGGYGFEESVSKRRDRERRYEKENMPYGDPNTVNLDAEGGARLRRKSTRRREGERSQRDADRSQIPPNDDGGLVTEAGNLVYANQDIQTPKRKASHRRDDATPDQGTNGDGSHYFQNRHLEQGLKDAVAESPLQRKSTRRRTSDRQRELNLSNDPISPLTQDVNKPSKADRLLGTDGAMLDVPRERRKHRDRDRDRDPNKRHSRKKSDTKPKPPLQFDIPATADEATIRVVDQESKVPGSFPDSGPLPPAAITSRESRSRRHKPSKDLQFDLPSDQPQPGDTPPASRTKSRRRREAEAAADNNGGGGGGSTDRPRRRKSAKEVNFEEPVGNDGDGNRQERDRDRDRERKERRERRKREKKSDKPVFGGYGRDQQ